MRFTENNHSKSAFVLIIGALIFAGAACSKIEIMNDDINPDLPKNVSFSVSEEEMSPVTRSAQTAPDIETKITGITLAAFREGTLYCAEHFSSSFTEMFLPMGGGSYTVYALVNMGDMSAIIPSSEPEMASLVYRIPSYTEGDSSIMTRGMPMAGSKTITITSSSQDVQTISVKRLLCKVELTLNCNWPGGQIISAKIHDMNRELTPFSENGSASSLYTTLPYQEVKGISGETTFHATFYVPENMQGTVPSITNSSDKQFHGNNIFSNRRTYLEVEANGFTKYVGSTKFVGSVTYRSYLGNNATSNFDLVRNTRYSWTVNYNEDGLLSDNWKVQPFLVAEPEAIDLGLSVKWASFNLGALRPEDKGVWLAWGVTRPKNDYDYWPSYSFSPFYDSYKWGYNYLLSHADLETPLYDYYEAAIPEYYRKYCTADCPGYNGFIDGKNVLDLEDDAAYVNLGGRWRMPTKEEWDELNCNSSLEQTTMNGVSGVKVSSTKPGYTDKWIFLPTDPATMESGDVYGSYWTSSSDYSSPYTYYIANYGGFHLWPTYDYRFEKHPIRPVLEQDEVAVEYDFLFLSSFYYNPNTFDENGGIARPSVHYGYELKKTMQNGATTTRKIWDSGGTIVYSMDEMDGFTLDSSSGIITVERNETPEPRSATVSVSVTLNGQTQTATAKISQGGKRIPASPEAIDLGLSVRWASFNLGATQPEEYGNYYAWGETEPKTDYDWTTYKWCMGNYSTMTKYCTSTYEGYKGFTDGKTVLDPEDDAAHVYLGSGWRMPTEAEWKELKDNCTWESTTLNGRDGYKVFGKKGKYKNNWIFLPEAGRRVGSFHLDSYGGEISTSTLDSRNSNYYSTGNSSEDRCYGRPVRPVIE